MTKSHLYHDRVRVLLVSTYELGHQPLHVASPAARLLSEGHEVRALDLSVEHWNQERFAWADKVAFSVPMHTAMRLAMQAATRVRRDLPHLPIAFYGLYAGIGASTSTVPAARIVGEYEDGLADWVNGSVPPGPVVVDLGQKKSHGSARQLLPHLDRYAALSIGGEERLAGYVEASHGCRHRCRHCPIPSVYGGRYRVTGLETVMADIERLVSMGARHVTFGDPDFLNAPPYALQVLDEAHRSFPDLTFDLTVKVEHIIQHEAVWSSVSAAGVVFVVSAFETTNQRILDILDKGHTAVAMSRAVEICRTSGIEIRPSWMPFTPWTESNDLADIMTFLDDHEMLESTDPIQLTIRLLIPENSLLLDVPGIDEFLNGYDPEALSFRWTSPHRELDDLHRDLVRIAEAGPDDPWDTLVTMWRRVIPARPEPLPTGRLMPRLTEAWFCCAEPSGAQMSVIGRPRTLD